ncbi:MAG: patatin-like phospholipase family protein [Chloroflexi bacterium]|nr:patatin-like phospholipase family protein [Chloroflexota bacterium]
MENNLAFVLGGGGARGALQVGALRALLETGIHPDILIGTSIGAINAAYLAMRGISLESLDSLVEAWRDAARADLLPSHYLRITLLSMINRRIGWSTQKVREFCLSHGLAPGACFEDIRGVRLYVVATDLNTGRPIIYGERPGERILEGVLASTALPPWLQPLQIDGKYLVDGGITSNLPIEPAIQVGASEIIALDLNDPRSPASEDGLRLFFDRLIGTVGQRQTELELALAVARGVPVHLIVLEGKEPVPIWDFTRTDELIEHGYNLACRAIASWDHPLSTPKIPGKMPGQNTQ